VSEQTGSLVAVDVREEPSVDDLDRARLQDFYDELERFRAVFAKTQAMVVPMLSEDAARLDAMGKAIRKLYGTAVEPLMTHVDQVLAQARRMTEPLPDNPLHRALDRRSGTDRRRADRAQIGPAFRAVPAAPTPAPVEAIPLPPPQQRPSSEYPTLRTRPLVAKHEGIRDPRPDNPIQASQAPTVNGQPLRGFPRTEGRSPSVTVTPPRPPSIPPLSLSAVRREMTPASEPELRITWEDPGGWGVL
jgi:hypothetical protein